MNRSRLLLMLLGLFFSFISLSAQQVWDGSVADSFAGGTGTQDDPYLISNGAELAYLSKIANDNPNSTAGQYYQLVSDIVLNEDVLDENFELKNGTPANLWTPIVDTNYNNWKDFQGDFDGNGHIISGLYAERTTYPQYVGLFGSVGGNGKVHDLAIIDSYILCQYTGGLVSGTIRGKATISRCYVEGRMTGYCQYAGLLVGSSSGTVEYCYSSGYNDGQSAHSGLSGIVDGGKVHHCFTAARVLKNGNARTGAIIGWVSSGTDYTTCYYDNTKETGVKAIFGSDKETCYGLTTEEMQSEQFATLLGEPFVFAEGNYPYIEGLPRVGETEAFNPAGFRISVGTLTNGHGSNIRFYREYQDGTLKHRAGYAEAGETIYIQLNIHKRMLLTDGSLKLINDETGQTVALTSVGENIWSFTMPEYSVSITAAFYRNPNLPLVWMGDVADSFAGGSGTEEDPYLISNGDELAYLAKLTIANGLKTKGVYYKLTADIILNEDVLTADHELNEAGVNEFNKWTPIGRYVSDSDISQTFQGNFDGNGYSISGLYYPDNEFAAGLFGQIYNGNVHDLSVLDSYVKAANMGGGIAGYMQSTGEGETFRVYNCYAEAYVVGGYSMGLAVGQVNGSNSSVDHCYTYGRASGSYPAGIVGYINAGRVEKCYSVCKSGYNGVYNNYATVSDLYFDSTVNSNGRNATGKTTNEMQSEAFVDLLGEPFEFVDGNYPYIDGLRQIGQGYTDKATGYRTNVGAMANSNGCTIKFFVMNGDGLKVVRRAEAGEKVYLRPILTHHMLMAESDLVLTNDATGREIALEKEGAKIYSFTMPEAEVTVKARFYINPKQAMAWDGSVADSFAGGTGTKEDPYQISNGAELAYLAKITNGNANATKQQYYRLTNDIVLNADVLDSDYQLIGTPQNQWTPIGINNNYPFYGDFDGANHVISGLYAVGGQNIGLFGVSSGCIHDLAVVDAYLYNASYSVGVICGYGLRSDSVSISRCYAEGSVYGYYTGLLLGSDKGRSTVEYCYGTGVVNTGYAAGGLVGDMYADMNHCYVVTKVDSNRGYGLVKITHSNTFGHLYYDKSLSPSVPVGINDNVTCAGKSTGEMISQSFADVLGEPFAYSFGEYPYIPGLPKIGEPIEFASAGYHVNIGTLVNTCGSSVEYYSEFDGKKVRKAIRSANSGETVYLKIDLGRRMLLIGGTLKVVNDTTGEVLTLTNVAEGIWSFTMPDFSVTVSASFHRDPNLPDIWEGDIAPEFAEGEGTEDDPYLIHDGAELAYLAQLCNANAALTKGKYYKLANDIFLNEDVLTDEYTLNGNPRNAWTLIGKDDSHKFQGVFDGDNHYITGVYVPSGSYSGLFGYVDGAVIRNLSLLDTYVYGGHACGLVYNAASTEEVLISRCYSEVYAQSMYSNYYATPLVGILGEKGTMENCYSRGLIGGNTTPKAGIAVSCQGTARNCFSAVKNAPAFYTATATSVRENCYSDEDLGGRFVVGDSLCSRHTIDMHTTDFAERIGKPFEYVLGNYPYIPGLLKIGENRGWKEPEDPTHGGAGGVWDGTTSVIFASGKGTKSDPYIINNGAQLSYLAKLTNANGELTKGKYYKLDADIVLNDSVLTNALELKAVPANEWEPIGQDDSHKFQGVFDGNNHYISGVYIGSGSCRGLFGFVNGATIRNLSLIDTYVKAQQACGLIYNAASTEEVLISHCYAEAYAQSIYSNHFATPMVGELGEKGIMEYCYSRGMIGGSTTPKAGLVITCKGTVRNCFSAVMNASAFYTATATSVCENCYSDEDLGGRFVVGDSLCSRHTIDMHTTDFAERIGKPFEYVLGNYPYIPGLLKIGENRGWKEPEDPTHGGAGGVWDGTTSVIFASGKGTKSDPYIINNGAQLSYLAKLTNANGELTKGKYYRLEADITLNNRIVSDNFEVKETPKNAWEPIGKDSNHKFQGVFDGNNYTISGLYVASDINNGALFGYAENVKLHNLSLVDTYITSSRGSALVNMVSATDTSIVNYCYVDAYVKNNYCTGMINTLGAKCELRNSYITGQLEGKYNTAGLVYLTELGSTVHNCYSAMKNIGAIGNPKGNVLNVYFDSNRAGSTSNVRDDFRSAETPEMLSTDFADRMGEPFEYAVGYYPYIYGLHKIDENGKTCIVNGYSLQLGTLENGNDCTVAFYRGYKKKTKELSLPVVPGSKVFVDNATTIYVQVNSSAIKRLTDEGLIVTANTSGDNIEVTEVDYDLYSFQITDDAVTVAGAFLDGNFCGDPEVNNGRDVKWQLSDSKSKLTIEGVGNMVAGAWTAFANSVQTIEIVEGVTNIATQAFKGMNKVTTATLPETLEAIGTEAFSGCTATVDLRPCTLLTALHANEFAQYTGTLYLPATVTTIEADAFAGTYANVQHVYSPVVDGLTLFANDVQVVDVDGMGDIARYGITDNQEVRLVWGSGYLVTAIANSDGKLKVYADEALNKEIPAGYKAIRTDDQTRIYLKVEPKNTKILFLDGLTVKAGSSTLAARQESDEVFSFLMPKSAVTISAQFATGGYCGNTNVNNGHNLIWTLYGSELAFQKNSFAQGEDMTMGNNAPWSTLGSSIEAVDLNNVTSIGNNAFTSCTNLVGLKLPATPVITVGDNAFANQMVLIIPAESWDSYQDAGWAAYAEQTAKDKETLTLADGLQWRTYYSKVGRMLPEGLKVYTVTNIGYDEVVMSTPLNYVPAGQAVLIENSEKTASTAEAVTSLATCLLTTDEDNLLQWITEPTTVSAGQGYTLYKDEFVMVSSGTLPANIAFLPAQGSSASRLGISITETTGIEATESTPSENGDLFNLKGQRVDRPSVKGIYLRNGKKVIIK